MLTPLLRLTYRDSIADAVASLGRPEEIANGFAGIQLFVMEQQQQKTQEKLLKLEYQMAWMNRNLGLGRRAECEPSRPAPAR